MVEQGSRSRRWTQEEPGVDELLADPACRLLMRSDGVTPRAVAALLDRVRTARGGTGERFVLAAFRGDAA